MSKSLGNVIAPQKISETLGAEVLRLWAAATDYSGELFISDEILKRVVETYRRIRNTLRFLLANTSDFDIERDAMPVSAWIEIDRYAVALAEDLQLNVLQDYQRYEFHPAVTKLQNFCSEDLGAFYLDVLKDRLYTCAKDSVARRSAQNALYHITQSLLRLMAPILSFTAEEAWKVFRPGHETIFAETSYQFPEIDNQIHLKNRWGNLREIRKQGLKHLEDLRVAGKIGSSLQAEAEIFVGPSTFDDLSMLGDDLRFVLITSKAVLHKDELLGDTTDDAERIRVQAVPSQRPKCERCWHWRADVGAEPKHPGVCGRCVSNLSGPGEPRRSHAGLARARLASPR
jgi:isoleucyl-tRNA synthetase